MPSSLKYKKIYIDSKFRDPTSNSSSDFKIEIPETISFNENTVVYCDDICIPNVWDTIIENINDKLYFKVYNTNLSPEPEWNIIAKIDGGLYNPIELAVEIQNKMNTLIQPLTGVANMFSCSYVAKTNRLVITMNDDFYAFRIITSAELKTTEWLGTNYDRNKPDDINDILSNLNDFSIRCNKVIPYISGGLFLQPFNNIYIHATNLGNYNTIGCQNERNILKKVPVSANRNFMIFDQCVLINDYIDVSNTTIKTLYFQLKSSKGNTIPLNGCNWSFSLVFSKAQMSDL